MYKFTKNISCEDPEKCVNNIKEKLEIFLGVNITPKNDKVSGHMSCKHTNGNHLFWIFLYSKNGVNESENSITKKIIEQKSDKVKKFPGTFPKESELKNAL